MRTLILKIQCEDKFSRFWKRRTFQSDWVLQTLVHPRVLRWAEYWFTEPGHAATTAWHMILNQKACGCKRRYMKSVLGTTVSAFRRIIGTRCHFVDKRRERSGWAAGGRQWMSVVRSAGILLEDLLIYFQVLHLLILSTFFGSSWGSCWCGLLPAHLKDQSHRNSEHWGAALLSASIYYSVNAFHPRFKKHLQRWQKSGNCLQSVLRPRCSVRPQPERPRVRGRRRRFWRKPRPSTWRTLCEEAPTPLSSFPLILQLLVHPAVCRRAHLPEETHTHTSHISLQHLIHPLQQTSGPVCRLATRPDPGLTANSFQKHSVFSQCAAFSWSFINVGKSEQERKMMSFLLDSGLGSCSGSAGSRGAAAGWVLGPALSFWRETSRRCVWKTRQEIQGLQGKANHL